MCFYLVGTVAAIDTTKLDRGCGDCMTQDVDRIEAEDASGVPTEEDVMRQARALVGALLDAGADAPHISYAFAYIATELGLVVAANPVRVFPVVLSAVSQAAADRGEHDSES